MKNTISFVCWKDDKPLDIQLEPEAFVFTVHPGNEIKFVPIAPTDNFHWSLRINHIEQAIQLFPDSPNDYSGIEIYMNDEKMDFDL